MKLKNNDFYTKLINMFLNACIFVFGAIFLITIYINIQTRVFGKNYADFFGYSLFEVQTGSMKDAINAGDWIIVKSSNDFKLDDIVTYSQNDDFITHRIVAIYNGTYITKGDANNTKDDPINKDQIIGKVTKVLRNFGILRKTIFNPTVLIAIILTIFLFNLLFKGKKTQNKKLDLMINKIKEKTKKINIKKITAKKQLEKKENSIKLPETEVLQEMLKTSSEEQSIEDNISSVIPVDISELDDTFLEIAENEIEDATSNTISKQIEIEDSLIVEEEPQLTKINLELLENTQNKKSKNLIEKLMLIKIEELNEIINSINFDSKSTVNEPTIKNTFMSIYIDAKYYNYYGEKFECQNKKVSLKIEKLLKEKAELLFSNYKGNDSKYLDKINKYLKMFVFISNIDQTLYTITDQKARNEFYKKELIKYLNSKKINMQQIKNKITEIMRIQRNYVSIVEYFYKKLETTMFTLHYNRLITNKNTYVLELEHNICFSRVYSDYIIDKTYNEGIIAEDKTIVLLNLLSLQLVKDMMSSSFEKKYILYLPQSLYTKEKKLQKTLKLIDDEYAKESVTVLVLYEDLLKYKTLINKLIKSGIKFSVVIDKEVKFDEKIILNLCLMEKIYVDKKIVSLVKMLSTVPEELVDKILYEDIISKIGDFGGEQ